jgi:hypothetical protein
MTSGVHSAVVRVIVNATDVAVAVAAALSTTVVPLVTEAIVVPGGMPAPAM